MVHLMKPVMLRWLRWQHRCYSRTTLHHYLFHSPSSTLYTLTTSLQPPLISTVVPSFHRTLHFRSQGLKSPYALDSRYSNIDDSDDPNARKSRNEKKREARRAVGWGMELAAFSTPQIKRILRVASLEPEVFDAIMLVKVFVFLPQRLGRDVREGKRRQFNYIGRLLRDAEPELMDGLIQATKDGDQNKFQALSGSEMWDIEDDDDEVEETEYEDEEEGSHNYINMATRWSDGLINKDADITKEIYSVQDVDFDRQDYHSKTVAKRSMVEDPDPYSLGPCSAAFLFLGLVLRELRRLVREVHSMQERQVTSEENEGEADAALNGAERSLARFLRTLAKQLQTK
ncbi:hypothetical protein TEA_005371 [Camellia sinensis var. sinensis]|uniref:Uncharacterized protein n=1 Tax=Camellia sinensis var. sinensis TaxID=542762 RepID=A0A4S4DLL0_CAMSN|nr:hypothetical protein TEA_005371 [Camellia sinensis var. sinensis]